MTQPGETDGLDVSGHLRAIEAQLASLGIDERIPDVVRAKFARAQTLYLLGWVDLDVALMVGDVATTTCATRVALPLDVNDNPWARRGDAWRP